MDIIEHKQLKIESALRLVEDKKVIAIARYIHSLGGAKLLVDWRKVELKVEKVGVELKGEKVELAMALLQFRRIASELIEAIKKITQGKLSASELIQTLKDDRWQHLAEGKSDAAEEALLRTLRDFLRFYVRAKQNSEVEKWWKENGNGKSESDSDGKVGNDEHIEADKAGAETNSPLSYQQVKERFWKERGDAS